MAYREFVVLHKCKTSVIILMKITTKKYAILNFDVLIIFLSLILYNVCDFNTRLVGIDHCSQKMSSLMRSSYRYVALII